MLSQTFLFRFALSEPVTAGHFTGIIVLSIGVVLVSREIESSNKEFRFRPSFDFLIPLGAMFFSGIILSFSGCL